MLSGERLGGPSTSAAWRRPAIPLAPVYNYFDSKSDLIAATVERVWCDIFHIPDGQTSFKRFQTALNGPMNVCGVGMKYILVSSPCTP